MKKEDRQMIVIYALIIIIIVLIVMLTKVVISSVKKEPKQNNNVHIQKIEIDPYPKVNDECTFNVKMQDYNALTQAGCEGGYTRYNVNDININETNLKVSIVYSDKGQAKTGLFINDKKVRSNIDGVQNIKFGIFDNKLFVLDKTNNEANALAYNYIGKEIYNLKKVLEKEKITDLSTGDTVLTTKKLNRDTFIFAEGMIEFDSSSNTCQNGEKAKGSHYRVTYKDETFQKPEFMELISC